jgi:hypothetical protein
VIVVCEDWAAPVQGYAAGRQAGNFECASAGVAQEDIRGEKHLVSLLWRENAVRESTSKILELCVELSLDDFWDGFACFFDNGICRQVDSGP